MSTKRSIYFRPEDRDKGYAWLCLFSAFIISILETGQFAMQGVFFVEFVEYFETSNAATAVIGSLCLGFTGMSGLFLGPLVSRFGLRRIVIVGSLVSSLGLALSVLAPNIIFLYFTLGVALGFGNSCFMIGYILGVLYHFDKRASLAFGIQNVGNSFGAFIIPMIAEALIRQFSWKGALLILAGLQLQGVICGALFRPLQPPPDDKTKNNGKSRKEKFKSCMSETVDLSLFKEPRVVSHYACIALFISGHVVPYMYLPSRAVAIGESKARGALLAAILGLVSGISQVFFGYVGDLIKTWKLIGLAIAGFCGGALMIVSYGFNVYTALAIYSALHGLVSAVYNVYYAAALGEILPPEKHAQGTGICMFIFGSAALVTVPLAGAIVDKSGSYGTPFLVFGVVMMVAATLACVTFVLQKRHLRKQKSEDKKISEEEIVDTAESGS